MDAIQKLLRNSGSSLVANLVTLVAGVGVSIILARTLGPSGRGAVAICVLMGSVFALLLSGGVWAANVYFIRTDKTCTRTLIANSALYVCIASVLALGLYWLTDLLLCNSALKGIPKNTIALSYFIVPLSIGGTLLLHVLLGAGRVYLANLAVISQQLAYVLGMCGIVVLGFMNTSTAMISYLFCLAVNVVFVVITLRGDFTLRNALDIGILRDSVVYGIPVQIGTLLQFLSGRIDFFLVSAFLDLTNAGLYAVAVPIAETMLYVPNAVAFALLAPSGASSEPSSAELAAKTARYVLLIGLVNALLITVSGQTIIEICFGPKFRSIFAPVIILLPGMLSLSVFRVLNSHAIVGGRTAMVAKASMAGFISLVSLDLLLIPRAGLIGAALASSISNSVASFVVIRGFCKVNLVNWSCIFPRLVDLRSLFSALWKFAVSSRDKAHSRTSLDEDAKTVRL
jgi:O-antigen/teichoic acid export membrane protein